MTLLELPVKELPKRGGWLAIFRVFPDCNVAEKFISDFKVSYGTDSNCDQYIESEETGEILTREQYEAAIAAQQPVWNGEGLPPVGAECEIAASDKYIKISHPEGTKVKIYACFTDDRGVELAAFVDSAGSVGGVGIAKCFRPIRTEADRKRGEAIDALISLGVFTRPVAEKTVDAIAAGKIPGLELTK